MRKILFALASTLSLYACNPDNQPQPGNNNNNTTPTPPSDPTQMFCTFTYTINGETYTWVEAKRNYTAVSYGIDDSFDRILNIVFDNTIYPEFSARFAIPILRGGTQVFDTLNMVRPIKGNAYYTSHLAMNFTINRSDTTFFPNNDDDDPRPGHTVTYTSLQDIGDITDTIFIGKGPYASHYSFNTWDVWEASGTFIDTVQGATQIPGEPDGILGIVDKEYPVTGTFTVRFLKKQ